MDCVDENICNCKRDCNCGYGYECCAQDIKNPTLGICVKIGCCDTKRGIPSKHCLENKKCKGIVENYNEVDKKYDIIILLIIILIVLLFFYKKIIKSYK